MWLNGAIVDDSEARVSIFDSSLRYGDGVFDMTRSFNCEPFMLDEHIGRFMSGCETLEIPIAWDHHDLRDAYFDLMKCDQWRNEEHRGLFVAGRGAVPWYIDHVSVPPWGRGSWVAIVLTPLRNVVGPQADLYDGVKLQTVEFGPQFPQWKHQSRVHFRIAELDVRPGETPLIVTESGRVSETTGANFFAVFPTEHAIVTPEHGCLAGVSRQYVLELAERLSMTVVRRTLYVSELRHAREAFLTCTPLSIVPVASIDGVEMSHEWRAWRRLCSLWVQDVGCDFVAQAREWANGGEG